MRFRRSLPVRALRLLCCLEGLKPFFAACCSFEPLRPCAERKSEAPDYDCFNTPPKLTFNRVVPLKESSDKKKLEGRGNEHSVRF